jgi:serine phosphatase RsbU (regulator of sigma subunit)
LNVDCCDSLFSTINNPHSTIIFSKIPLQFRIMETAARRFARWVLFIHLLLLVSVVTLVCFAARDVYRSALNQAKDQAVQRQTLLAEQTARGIESYFTSILDNLELLRRTENPQAQTQPLPATLPTLRPRQNPALRGLFAAVLWHQLQHRASHFLIIDREPMQVLWAVPEGTHGKVIMDESAGWLRTITQPSISKLTKVEGEDSTLLCVPVSPGSPLLYVVVVGVQNIDQEFLKPVNDQQRMSAMLLSDDMHVLAAGDASLIGLSMIDDVPMPRLKAVAERYIQSGTGGTELVQDGFKLGQHDFASGIVSIQPVQIAGKRWWLTIGSDFQDVDSVVRSTFRNALLWAIFVIVTVTAILVSTAIQMIRSRMRMERFRHDLLTRELSQARRIQLAWLPKNDDDPKHVDLNAINKPASHISGDFYNWFSQPHGQVCVVIGDVTGHGMAAAFLMATTQLLVRMIMPRVHDPGKCLEEVNRQLCQQVFNGQFVTMQILMLDRASGRVQMSSAGHPPPLISHNGSFEAVKLETELVLGVESDTEYVTQTFDLPDGASIVLYTDGVIDAQGPHGRRFGIGGLRACLHGKFKTAHEICDRVIEAVDVFRDGRELADDLTLVTIQLEPVASQTDEAVTASRR